MTGKRSSGKTSQAGGAAGSGGSRSAVFDFTSPMEGLSYPSVSADVQTQFTQDFYAAVGDVETWLSANGWLSGNASRPPPVGTVGPPGLFGLPGTDFQVFVSKAYPNARAIDPAWGARRGVMQFPAYRAGAREADHVHELIHVYLPNGHRMLAEGLAVYVQQKIGRNGAFPNFSGDLHRAARTLTCPRPKGGGADLQKIDLSALDQILTPDDLIREVAGLWYDAGPTYIVAGSFVQFLLEGFETDLATAMDEFRALYELTPLMPTELNGGDVGRWTAAYGAQRPLSVLEAKWKAMIAAMPCP